MVPNTRAFGTVVARLVVQVAHGAHRRKLQRKVTRSRKTAVLILVVILPLLSGCASFNHRSLEQVGFEQRALSKTDGGITVSVVALSEDETIAAVGANLAAQGIQPVWIKIENNEDIGFVIPPMAIDHDYFSPSEAAWRAHGWLTETTYSRIDAHLLALRLPLRVGPGEIISGFVFTNLDKG